GDGCHLRGSASLRLLRVAPLPPGGQRSRYHYTPFPERGREYYAQHGVCTAQRVLWARPVLPLCDIRIPKNLLTAGYTPGVDLACQSSLEDGSEIRQPG